MLKSFFCHLITPWGAFWAGVFLLFIFRKRFHRIFGRLLATLLGVLYLLSITSVKNIILYPLEKQSYEMNKEPLPSFPKPVAIVVLGGGISSNGKWQAPRLGHDPLARLVHGIRIYEENKGSIPLIFTSGLGNPSRGIPSEGDVASTYLASWKIKNYFLEEESANTFENAIETKKLLGKLGKDPKAPVILVTSAIHMPRAAGVFRAQGLKVLARPSHYAGSSTLTVNLSDFLWPNVRNIATVTHAWHEYVGLLAYKFQGRI